MTAEEAAERAFEAEAREAVGAFVSGPDRVEEGPFTGESIPGSFPRLNFYASGPASEIRGSQRVIVVAESRVWSAGGEHDDARATLREIDAALKISLEDRLIEVEGHRIHVVSVGSFQPIPGSHLNIRGRRRVFAFQVIKNATTQ